MTFGAKVQELFGKWAGADQPGAAIAVSLGEGAAWQEVFVGAADLAQAVPISKASVFHYCSISKALTAAAFCVLHDRGDLDLDAPISDLLPEFPAPDAITVRALLNMTAGLQDSEEVLCLANVLQRTPGADAHWLRHGLRNADRAFPPATATSYTNTHYILLSEALSRQTGQTFETAVRTLVLDPIAIGGIHLRSDPRQVTPGLARGYVPSASGRFVEGLAFGFLGGGGFVGTLGDLTRFLEAFAADDLAGTPIRSMMARPGRLANGVETNYGLGCFLHEWRGVRVIGHNGGMPGYKTWAAHMPELDLQVAFLSNRDDAQSSQHLRAIIDLALADRSNVPARPRLDRAAIARLSHLEGEWVCTDNADHFTLTLKDSHIALSRMGFPARLRPVSPDVYRDNWFVYTTELRIGDTGDRLVLSTHGEAPKHYVRPANEAAADQGDLIGNYRADQHGLCHQITAEGDALVLTLCRNPHLAHRFALRPLGKDCFAIADGSNGAMLRRGIKVLRDGKGAVTGLRYRGARLHQLEVSRVESLS